ncbi:MAG: YwaF family protein [Bacilli bacterium]|nr:YwaF family protein [Bacilli bacterium]
MFFVTTTAPLYGLKHFIGLLMMLGLSAMYFVPLIIYRNKLKPEQKALVLKLTIIFMWLLEIIKFVILLRVYGNIPLGEFPYALCSTPLYLFPFVAFGKSKFSEFLKPSAFVVGLLAGAISLLYPSNILGDTSSWFSFSQEMFPLRSFVYHTVMILFSVNMLLSGNYRPKKGDLFKAISVLLVLAAIAVLLNALIPNADFFMLGMGYGSPFAFLMDISKALYILVMVAIALFIITILYLPFELMKKKAVDNNSLTTEKDA